MTASTPGSGDSRGARDGGTWARLHEVLTEPGSSASAPSRICAAATDLLSVSGATISISGELGMPAMVCSTDDRARRVNDLQVALGEGPGLTAMELGQPVLVPDLGARSETRWPMFTRSALAAGVCSIFAFPLRIGAIGLGVLDLYRDRPGRMGERQLSDALLVADAATLAVIREQDERPAGDLDQEWWDLDSFYRVEVNQATGMVMAQLGVVPVEALLRLRGYAFAQGLSLIDASRAIIERRVRLTGEVS
ncbi:MAG: hypothetical protein QOC98_972 [Frankiaceae bacterium]|jgi:hypothetical protein|nr:hypothetical protein [Frankiaceae bacterium]